MSEQKRGIVRLPDGRIFNFEDHNLYAEDSTLLKDNLQGFEYDVFYCLADHYPTPQSVDQLISLIWEKKTPPITPDPSRVRQVIGALRNFLDDQRPFHLILYVKKGIYSEGGYKCCAHLLEAGDAPFRQGPEVAMPEPGDVTQTRNVNLIKLSSVLIHKGGQDHPKIGAELELEIQYIIDLLEQGLSEDFEEACEQAWEELTLIQKAMKIFRAYENLTVRSRNLGPDGPNTRL